MENKIIRFFDILISALILLILFPILVLIPTIIFFFDGAPIIFTQYRVGYNGKLFKIYKFRTMKNLDFVDDYFRLTFFGKFLRKTSLDELPQLFNVLKKDMSLVGPRPLPADIESNIIGLNKIKKRRKILPGITGMSQVNYTGKKRTLMEKVELDLKFVDNYNTYNYFKILGKTPIILIIRSLKNKSSIIK